MGKFTESVRELFGQVFGKADFEHVLKDHWDFADSFPEDQRLAMQVRSARKKGRSGPWCRTERVGRAPESSSTGTAASSAARTSAGQQSYLTKTRARGRQAAITAATSAGRSRGR